MAIEFNQDKFDIWIAPEIRDANGNLTTIQNPQWESSNPNLATVDVVNENAAVHLVHPVRNQTGTCQLTLTGDADLGDGIMPISHTEDLLVGPGNAASIVFVPVAS